MNLLSRLFKRAPQKEENATPYVYTNTAGEVISWPNGLKSNCETPVEALAVSSVFTCVNAISSALAVQCLVLSKEDNELVKSHPLVKLLRYPNRYETGLSLLEKWFASVVLYGNGFVWAVRSPELGKYPFELHHIPTRNFSELLYRNGTYVYKFVVEKSDNRFESVELPANEVLHLKWNTPDERLGRSPVYSINSLLTIINKSEQYSNFILRQGQMMPYVLQSDVSINKEKKLEIAEYFRLATSGLEGLNKIPVLDSGFKLSPTSNSVEFVVKMNELRKQVNQEVAACFGVPDFVVDPSSNKYNSNEGKLLAFKESLQIWNRRITDELNFKLLTDYDKTIYTFTMHQDLNGVIPYKDKSAIASQSVNSGLMTRNEARMKLLGLPKSDKPEADELYIPLNTGSNNTQAQALEMEEPEQPENEPQDNKTEEMNHLLIKDLEQRINRREEKYWTKTEDKELFWTKHKEWLGQMFESFATEQTPVDLIVEAYCEARQETLIEQPSDILEDIFNGINL